MTEPGLPAGARMYEVVGESMLPSLEPGDILIVDTSGEHRAEVGDVVLIDQGDEPPVAHRVAAARDTRSGRRLITSGDESGRLDNIIGEAELLGRVVGVMRGDETLDVPARAPDGVARVQAEVVLLLEERPRLHATLRRARRAAEDARRWAKRAWARRQGPGF